MDFLWSFLLTVAGIGLFILVVAVMRRLWVSLVVSESQPSAAEIAAEIRAQTAAAQRANPNAPAVAPNATTAPAAPAPLAEATLAGLKWAWSWVILILVLKLIVLGVITLLYPNWYAQVFLWNPDLRLLITVLVVSLVFLRFAPPVDWKYIGTVKAIAVAFLALFVVNTIFSSGFGSYITRTVTEYDTCLGNPKCVATTPPETKRTQPDTRIQSVKIIECRLGWSRVIPVRVHSGTLYWNWRVRTQYLWKKQWHDHIPDTNVDGEAVRFCHDGELAGKDMPLDWR